MVRVPCLFPVAFMRLKQNPEKGNYRLMFLIFYFMDGSLVKYSQSWWNLEVLFIVELLPIVSVNQQTNLNYIVGRRIVIKLLVTYFQRNHSKEVCKILKLWRNSLRLNGIYLNISASWSYCLLV